MKFVDPFESEQGTTRTEFHKLSTDLQLAIEELDHTLATLGFQLIIKSCVDGVLEMEVWVS